MINTNKRLEWLRLNCNKIVMLYIVEMFLMALKQHYFVNVISFTMTVGQLKIGNDNRDGLRDDIISK